MEIEVNPIGTARTGYRVWLKRPDGAQTAFDVRTRSPRRYLVVGIHDGTVWLRTDNRETARKLVRKYEGSAFVIDRRVIDGGETMLLRTV